MLLQEKHVERKVAKNGRIPKMSLLFIKCYSRALDNDQHGYSSKTCFDRKFSLKNIQTKHFCRLSGRTRKHVEEDRVQNIFVSL